MHQLVNDSRYHRGLEIAGSDMDRLPESINFANEEKKVLENWKKLDVFKSCLKQSKGKPRQVH